MPDRRSFLKRGAVLGGGLLLSRWLGPSVATASAATTTAPVATRARVVSCRHARLRRAGVVDSDRLADLLDETLQALFDVDTPLEAWSRVVRPEQTVGLKVNCLAGRGLSTSPQLVAAITERLRRAGVAASRIVVWDRMNADLEEAGFPVATRGRGVRRIGNEVLGFERRLSAHGAAGSLLCRTLTQLCDVVINLPVLKDHGITGVTGALKNLFGAIHNPNKYHLGTGDPYIPDVYRLGPIRQKVRLHLCDATMAQYEGGPSFLAHWAWPCDRLLASLDPVALDRTCWGIIEAQRALRGLDTLAAAGREPTWIATAAQGPVPLGIADPACVELLERELA